MDLIDVTIKLRELVSACDVAGDALGGSFTSVDPELEALASQLRPGVYDTGVLIYGFLERLEKNSKFIKQRANILKRRTTP